MEGLRARACLHENTRPIYTRCKNLHDEEFRAKKVGDFPLSGGNPPLKNKSCSGSILNSPKSYFANGDGNSYGNGHGSGSD